MTGAPSDELRDVYERRAARQYAEPVAPDPSLDRKYQRVRELVSERLPCEAFLDAGCGDGRHLAAVGAAAGRLVGVDIAERILDTARATLAVAGVEAELLRGNLEALPLEDSAFDLVLCTQVIEHLLDSEAGLRELARVTCPGGTLVLTTDNRRAYVSAGLNAPRDAVAWLARRGDPFDFPHRAFRAGELGGLLERAGLAVDRVETFRFHLRSPLGRPGLQRVLNRLDRALPAHGFGDVLVVVARRPAG